MKLGLDGVDPPKMGTTKQVKGAFLFALMKMAGFRPDKIHHAFPEKWEELPTDSYYPTSSDEIQTLQKELHGLKDKHGVIFHDNH